MTERGLRYCAGYVAPGYLLGYGREFWFGREFRSGFGRNPVNTGGTGMTRGMGSGGGVGRSRGMGRGFVSGTGIGVGPGGFCVCPSCGEKVITYAGGSVCFNSMSRLWCIYGERNIKRVFRK